jgi:hypothetical protein
MIPPPFAAIRRRRLRVQDRVGITDVVHIEGDLATPHFEIEDGPLHSHSRESIKPAMPPARESAIATQQVGDLGPRDRLKGVHCHPPLCPCHSIGSFRDSTPDLSVRKAAAAAIFYGHNVLYM